MCHDARFTGIVSVRGVLRNVPLFFARSLNLRRIVSYRRSGVLKVDSPDEKNGFTFTILYANGLWKADTMCGPHIKVYSGKSAQTFLLAFLLVVQVVFAAKGSSIQ
jgi:hypothetical protein